MLGKSLPFSVFVFFFFPLLRLCLFLTIRLLAFISEIGWNDLIPPWMCAHAALFGFSTAFSSLNPFYYFFFFLSLFSLFFLRFFSLCFYFSFLFFIISFALFFSFVFALFYSPKFFQFIFLFHSFLTVFCNMFFTFFFTHYSLFH